MDKGRIKQILEEWNVWSCDNSALADRLLKEFSPEEAIKVWNKRRSMTREEARSWIIDHWGNDLEDGTKQSEVVKICLSALSDKGEWIPVSERLPKDDTNVVILTELGTVGSCHYFEGFNNYPGCSRDYIFDDIVAWLPIPEVPMEKDCWNAPYKAESEE